MKTEKMKRWMIHIGAVILLVILGIGICHVKESQTQHSIAQKVLRFHVRANSDSQEDQKLKLAVRDAVGELLGQYLSEADSRQDSEEIVKEHMEEIVNTATEVIEEEGYHYGVEVFLSDVDFPVKKYGAYTFPAGTYRALEIVIGSGTGHNWWCVMYPNMCFVNGTYDVVDENSKKELEQTLSAQEYATLMEEKDYQVSFRIVEEIQNLIR